MLSHNLALSLFSLPLGLFLTQLLLVLFWGMPHGKDPVRFAAWLHAHPQGGQLTLALWGLLSGVVAWSLAYLPYHAN